MSKSILGLFAFCLTIFSLRAEQPIFNISSLEATPGEIIEIDLNVDDFAGLISVQFSVNWDPAVLSFREVKNFNAGVPGLNASLFGTSTSDEGEISLSWLESSVTPITIPDGSRFFTIEFEVVGDPCDQSAVAITGTPSEIEVSEDGVNNVGLVSNDGSVEIPGSGCSEVIEIIGNTITGACGETACVQFTVENFTDVGVMEFSLAYDPNVLEYIEFDNFGPLPGFNAGNTALFAPGILRVVWFNNNIENSSLPDGTTLFNICFNVIGTGGQSSTITFGNNPPPEIADIDENPHEVNLTPASITAECALEGFALIADNLCITPGGEICMDIKVNDFDDIIAMQFSINWDSTKFEFSGVEGFNLEFLDEDAFGTPEEIAVDEGQLTVAWLDLALQGVSVPDFTTIFRLCLTAVGPVNTTSPVTFTSTPLEIEIATEDSTLVFALVNGSVEIKADCDPDPISFTINGDSPSCPGVCDGSINLTVTESLPGNPTFIWNTNPPQTSEDLTGLCAGNYCVTITVDNQVVVACQDIIDPAAMSITSVVTPPNPPGSSTGAINITISGGMPPYMVSWNTVPPTNTEDLINIPAGIYIPTITDANGCVFVADPVTVGGDLTAAITNVTCPGGNNGAINLTASFGTGPYTFIWNTTPPQSNEDLTSLRAGTYCVTVTDNTGSTRDSCFIVTQPNMPNVTATITHDFDETCMGAIDLNVTGATNPVTYLWSSGETTQDILNKCGGMYCVTITYGLGCVIDTCFTILSGDELFVQLQSTAISCGGLCDGEVEATIIGGAPPYTFAWSTNATTNPIENLCAGTYRITVTDATGTTATNSITLSAPPAITVIISETDPSGPGASDGALSAVVIGGTPDYTYQWSGPVTGNTASLLNIPAGGYLLVVTDDNGCQVTRFVSLGGAGDCYKAISIITPNSDGKNDFFIIDCVQNAQNHLYIFNRQGGLVYDTPNYQNNWIGVDNDEEYVPDGGYHWVLEVQGFGGTPELYKGTVTVLRTAD